MNRPQTKNIVVEYYNSLSSTQVSSEDDVVVFLAGPTPQYPLAIYSWRDKFAEAIDSNIHNDQIQNRKIILVCPEPFERKWNHCGFDAITWEHEWLERSDIILFWHETRWTPNIDTIRNCYHGENIANIGVQFRFEVGMYINDHRKIRIFYVPDHARKASQVLNGG